MTTVLGGVAVALVIAGLIVGSEALLLALASVLLLLWLVATVRHAVEGTRLPERSRPATAH